MDEQALRFLRYTHQSLADAASLAPSMAEDRIVEVMSEELERGFIGEHARKRLFALAKKSTRAAPGSETDEERLWPLGVVIMPRVYGLRPEHGRRSTRLPLKVVPLMLFARLDRNGVLTPEDGGERQAILSRDLLEPNRHEISIGSVEAADTVYAKQKDRAETWPDLMRKGIGILEQVCGASYEEVGIDRYERLETGYALLSGGASSTWSIQRLVDLLQAAAQPEAPLFETLIARADDRHLLAADRQLDLSLQHLGQMECRHGLSASQREALMHHLASQSGPDILAVDGPPGTGKTTLLLSVIATLWVKHALEESEPPIIVATSTNNQAVTNILRVFAEVKEAQGPLAGRWLPGLRSYGLYLPAKTRTGAFDFPVHEMRGIGREALFDAQRYEDKAGCDEARGEFLKRFKEAFATAGNVGLAQAVGFLHARLRDEITAVTRAVEALKTIVALMGGGGVSSAAIARHRKDLHEMRDARVREAKVIDARLDAARQLRAVWKAHVASEPWWVSLLAAGGDRLRRQAPQPRSGVLRRSGVVPARADGRGLRGIAAAA